VGPGSVSGRKTSGGNRKYLQCSLSQVSSFHIGIKKAFVDYSVPFKFD
jgi:hypothetical protein